ncbi:Phosphoglycolate phosphatase [Legionella gratiana]|uniref:phosphoglycolate phosphatase n=1 Tax=Legionella gratiana TaxID=45066 RepID=A0A378JFE9_9GAMM|nr:HAD family hydrolase [Legionella gratiana]KTD12051.1 Phosphoglycolate phosphatase [Legionella gratiana]STX46345.1 phosphoglycolate phosphatase [Legionella gratiana]
MYECVDTLQKNTHRDLVGLLQTGKAIIILDNDGTIFNSQPSEAWRIRTILSTLGETQLPTMEALLEIGYGKKNWADGLINALKEQFPHLSVDNLEKLKSKLERGSVDEVIVRMGQNMLPIPGAERFLLEMNKKGHKLAICSDNYSDTVAEAVNHHIRGVHCQLPDNREPHEHAAKKTMCPGDYLITLNDTMGVNLKRKYKPDPTKLLIQQFKALMELNVVNAMQLEEFIAKPEFRRELKSNANYRKTVYIGDDINDYLAAANANFDYFIASTKSGKCDEEQFSSKIDSNMFAIETIMVDNLQMLHEWINVVPCRITTEIITNTKVTHSRAGANSNGFFDSNSNVSTQETVQASLPTHSF